MYDDIDQRTRFRGSPNSMTRTLERDNKRGLKNESLFCPLLPSSLLCSSTSPSNIEGVEVSDSHLVAAFPKAKGTNIGGRRILVRSEYNEAEQKAVVLSSGQDYSAAFVVAGQPGIGSPPLSLRCP